MFHELQHAVGYRRCAQAEDVRLRVQGLGFKACVQGLGFKVQGLGFRVITVYFHFVDCL